MIVMKFGGSSVANSERIRHVAGIIQNFSDRKPVVVLSAMGDTTDDLLDAADAALSGKVTIDAIEKLHKDTSAALGIPVDGIEKLLGELRTLLTGVSMLRELSPRSKDYLVSFGERLSVRIMAAYLSSQGTPAVFYDAWDIGFFSDSNYTNAELLPDVQENIRASLGPYAEGRAGASTAIPVVTGFIAKDKNGFITTLGRGGSDLTATVIGSALMAEEVQTWKDVNGILTADPRIVKTAQTVPVATYDEVAELAYFGSQVLHPRSMQPCIQTGTPVRVKNSYNIDAPGSIIVTESETELPPVRSITTKKNVTLIDIVSTRMLGQYGFLAKVFDIFAAHNISVDVVATSEVSVSLTVDSKKADFSALTKDLGKYASIEIKKHKAIVTVICDVSRSSSILAVTFEALAREKINIQMISQGASKVNISLICESNEAERVVRLLHDCYFGADGKTPCSFS
ncbi:aspartate kinase [Brucepastera parasyntrophica]|uniref:aspartate kinase n=1 Tax=Brucepastera parasyntrophica TaxID=2880008 RepID=UPI00210914FC|nr:aspartate kinase [Brucepastera parasyntrophica]ULQ59694.1 aspartate kinase [Brucepastera parasyntrophica]